MSFNRQIFPGGKVAHLTFGAMGFLLLLTGCATPALDTGLETPYRLPLVSPGAQFANLPPAVQRTVRAQAGATQIVDIERGMAGNSPFYKVAFTPAEVNPPLYVAADGSVLNPDLTVAVGASYADFVTLTGAEVSPDRIREFLPPEVLSTVEARAPLSQVTRVSRQPWGERNVYLISFRDPKLHPTLYVTSEGTVMTEIPE